MNFSAPRYRTLPPELAIENLLGVTHQDLENTIFDCFVAYVSAGPLKPKGAGGTLAWMNGIETIRRQLIAKGWTPENLNNQPRVVSPDGKHWTSQPFIDKSKAHFEARSNASGLTPPR
ncbi:hypothetical protein [Cellvibrio polysaccharolyticus]|uniref:hypothetical protein n=1 Tax=Cellvibrio polysaccharolyticus TaxID=2082724 RepID=UPI00187E930A|nr:hypothetical protein [Cellvibrio polysaccharolyticus]